MKLVFKQNDTGEVCVHTTESIFPVDTGHKLLVKIQYLGVFC